jgi:hypothetical protein
MDETTTATKKSKYTPTQKLCIYRWRFENPESHKRINRKGNATYYAKNRQKVIQAVLERRKRKRDTIAAGPSDTLGKFEASDSVK